MGFFRALQFPDVSIECSDPGECRVFASLDARASRLGQRRIAKYLNLKLDDIAALRVRPGGQFLQFENSFLDRTCELDLAG